MRSGAIRYLLKSSAASELISAIHISLKGKFLCYAADSPRRCRKSFIKNPQTQRACKKPDTSAARSCAAIWQRVKSMKEVASVLHVTPRTVAFHKYRVMEEPKSRNDCGADSVRYRITNSHNVNPNRRALSLHCFNWPVPGLSLITLHRCSGEPNTGTIFREKGRHLIAQGSVLADDYRQTQRSLTDT